MVMENHFLSFPTLLCFVLFMFLTLKVSKRFKKSNKTSNLPPGPWKFPIFGNIHHLIGSQLPHHRLRDLSQKYGPLMHLQLGETSVIVVSSPEIAKETLKTNGVKFANRPHIFGVDIITYGRTNIGFSPYGDYWRWIRKICAAELLSAKRVRSLKSMREDEVSNLIKDIFMNSGSPINITNKILHLVFRMVARATFGDDREEDREAYIVFILRLLRSNEWFGVTNLFPSQRWLHAISGVKQKMEEFHKTGDMLLENIINAATTKIGVDGSLVSELLNLKDPDFHLKVNNIKAIVQDIIVAGSDPSSTTVLWAFSEMLKDPRVLKKAQAEVRQVFDKKGYIDETSLEEVKYLKAIIKETLRLHPPSPLLLPRECDEACNINGYTIPAGTQVFVNVWAIGRDTNYWNEAEKFYPERFLDCPVDYMGSYFEFIPFGAGKRICPGMSFAPPIIELPLAQLLYYFDWKLPIGTSHESLDMTETFGFTAKRKNDLNVIPIPYNPEPVK